MTKQELNKLLSNPKTKQLVEWIDVMSRTTKTLMSPEFFHKTHTEKERIALCFLIQNYFNCRVLRSGNNSVTIIF